MCLKRILTRKRGFWKEKRIGWGKGRVDWRERGLIGRGGGGEKWEDRKGGRRRRGGGEKGMIDWEKGGEGRRG